MLMISLVKKDDNTNHEITNDKCDQSRYFTLSFNIAQDDLDDLQNDVLRLSQMCLDELLQTKRVPLQNKQSCADTVIAHPPPPISQISARVMPSQLLICQMLTLFNKECKSDHTPTWVLLLSRSCGVRNVSYTKASGD